MVRIDRNSPLLDERTVKAFRLGKLSVFFGRFWLSPESEQKLQRWHPEFSASKSWAIQFTWRVVPFTSETLFTIVRLQPLRNLRDFIACADAEGL